MRRSLAAAIASALLAAALAALLAALSRPVSPPPRVETTPDPGPVDAAYLARAGEPEDPLGIARIVTTTSRVPLPIIDAPPAATPPRLPTRKPRRRAVAEYAPQYAPAAPGIVDVAWSTIVFCCK